MLPNKSGTSSLSKLIGPIHGNRKKKKCFPKKCRKNVLANIINVHIVSLHRDEWRESELYSDTDCCGQRSSLPRDNALGEAGMKLSTELEAAIPVKLRELLDRPLLPHSPIVIEMSCKASSIVIELLLPGPPLAFSSLRQSWFESFVSFLPIFHSQAPLHHGPFISAASSVRSNTVSELSRRSAKPSSDPVRCTKASVHRVHRKRETPHCLPEI